MLGYFFQSEKINNFFIKKSISILSKKIFIFIFMFVFLQLNKLLILLIFIFFILKYQPNITCL